MLDILQAQRISEDHAMDGSSVNLESPIKPEEIGKLESMRKNAAQSTKSLHAGIQDFGKVSVFLWSLKIVLYVTCFDNLHQAISTIRTS